MPRKGRFITLLGVHHICKNISYIPWFAPKTKAIHIPPFHYHQHHIKIHQSIQPVFWYQHHWNVARRSYVSRNNKLSLTPPYQLLYNMVESPEKASTLSQPINSECKKWELIFFKLINRGTRNLGYAMKLKKVEQIIPLLLASWDYMITRVKFWHHHYRTHIQVNNI